MPRVDIAFTLFQRDDKVEYPMALCAAYSSIRERTSAHINLHIIVDNSVSSGIRELIELSVKRSDSVFFYEASSIEDVYELSLAMDGRFSPAIIWRVWIEDYLKDLGKCILIDCDILFTFDILKIWDLDLNSAVLSAPLRGVSHPAELHKFLNVSVDKYFRMCCCLLDLDQLRVNTDFTGQRSRVLRDSSRLSMKGLVQAGFLEQSVFNYFFSENCMPLPVPVIPVDRIDGHLRQEEWSKVIERNEPFIIDIKGWKSKSAFAFKFWSEVLNTAFKEYAVSKASQWR